MKLTELLQSTDMVGIPLFIGSDEEEAIQRLADYAQDHVVDLSMYAVRSAADFRRGLSVQSTPHNTISLPIGYCMCFAYVNFPVGLCQYLRVTLHLPDVEIDTTPERQCASLLAMRLQMNRVIATWIDGRSLNVVALASQE